MRQWKNDKELFALMKTYLYTAVVGDIMDEMGLQNQFLPQRIRPLKENMILVGRAMTVLESDLVSDGCGTHNPALGGSFGLMLDALGDLKEDEVYVCSGSSDTYALVGELMATRAKQLKAAGFAVNGFIRDTLGILDLEIPTFSYGSYAQDQAPRGKVLDYRVPILVGQVRVNPGDIIFGDIDGVLAIPQAQEKEIIQRAYEKATGEKTVGEAIKAGMSAKAAFEKYGIM